MPIPSQNEILVPFLETLHDAQPHTRAQILYALAKRFDLSEDELNATTGQHFTMVNRVGWCDAYFNKAGFISKEKHPKDNLQDVFRITITGQNQLRRHRERITVGYLQSFYQGKVYRGAGSGDATSDAELDLFERLSQLPDPFVSFHSVAWIGHGTSSTIGEVDFLIAHPDYGVLVLEVKGGEISIERQGNVNVWKSRSRNGKLNEIQDPCAQAERNRWQLRKYLEDNRLTKRFRYALFPAVALPDAQVDADIRMDCRADIFIDHRHIEDLENRLLHIFQYWQHHADGKNSQMDGQPALEALVEVLIPQRQLRPRIGDLFERERQKIEQLTEEQFQLLHFIQTHRRAAIVGGAGTGKTMLAIEKAQQLADDGLQILFLAFNRNIVEWVSRALPGDRVTVTTYHSYVGTLLNRLSIRSSDGEDFYAQAAELLMQAAERLRLQEPDALFDAIIVDEAQDFDDEMWIPIPDLLKDTENGILYVFFDDNQRIYTQISNVPISSSPFPLTRNCRNTQRIHTTLMPYAVADTETICNGPEGRDVEVIPVANETAAKRELQRLLHRLGHDENIPYEDIVLLTPQSEKRSMWANDEILGNYILSWDMQTEMRMAVKVCSIYAYKGLESAVVILSELDKLHEDVAQQLLYVGLSRARNHAIVLGELPTPVTVA